MTSLGSAVQAAVRRGRTSGSYLGTVTAIDGVEFALTVDIGTGTPLTGVRWVGSYTPAVSDFVTVVRFGSAWVVLGKLSKNLTGPRFVEQTTFIIPSAWTHGVAYAELGSSWDWGFMMDFAQQGRITDPYSGETEYASVAYYPSVAAQIPSGATVTAAKMRMARIVHPWAPTQPSGASLVYPSIFGHARTTAPSPGATPASIKAAGYTSWRPGRLAAGASASWALPSAWLTALLSGTLRGVGIHSSAPADYAVFQPGLSAMLEITYRTPA